MRRCHVQDPDFGNQNILRVDDVFCSHFPTLGAVDPSQPDGAADLTLKIVLSDRLPPCGCVESGEARRETFEGWLGLMRVLYELVDGVAPEAR